MWLHQLTVIVDRSKDGKYQSSDKFLSKYDNFERIDNADTVYQSDSENLIEVK